ncbi:outer membrane beta-barrel protein, partial [Bacteroides heparinolyticus]
YYNFYRNLSFFSNIIYISPRKENTMKRDYFLRSDIGISGRFCKNKLYVSLQGNDLFAKGVASCYTNNYADTEQWYRGRFDTRGVNLTVRYTFNSIRTNFKSKSGNKEILLRTE